MESTDDLNKYKSFVRPGVDCPECLVDTGDSYHYYKCSIGQALGDAKRYD